MKKNSLSLLYGVAVFLILLVSCKKDGQTPVVIPPDPPKPITVTVNVVNNTPTLGTVTPLSTSVTVGTIVVFTFDASHKVKSFELGNISYKPTDNKISVNVTANLNGTVTFSDSLTTAEYKKRSGYLQKFWVDRADSTRIKGTSFPWKGTDISPCDTATYFGNIDDKGTYQEFYGSNSCGNPKDKLIHSGTSFLSYDGKYLTTTSTDITPNRVTVADVVELTSTDLRFIIHDWQGRGYDVLAHATPKK
jgi:hypothetical protein